MAQTITDWHIGQYQSNVAYLAQQKGSRLRRTVRLEMIKGRHAFFDQIGATAARRRPSRHADTPNMQPPHARRRVSPVSYDWAALVAEEDKIRAVTDPTSVYAESAGYALGRAIDDAIIEAADGAAYTGEDGTLSVGFDSNMIVGVQTGGSSSDVGLNVAKLIEAKRLLDANDIDPDIPRHIAVNARQMASLLNQTEVTSSDYNTVKALIEGTVDKFLGFQFQRIERIGVDGNGDDKVLFWAQDGLLLGVGKDVTVKIADRPDKNHETQVFACMDIGATRMEEAKVGYALCDPSAGPGAGSVLS